MANAIQQTRNGLTFALCKLPQGRSVKQAVHDGDTVKVALDGEFGIRFLSIDAPEVSLQFPGSSGGFLSLGSGKWREFLLDPFDARYGPFTRLERDGTTQQTGDAQTILGAPLIGHLRSRLGPDCAANHAAHGDQAQKHLEAAVQADVDEREAQWQDFRFFLAFAYTLIDRYGRLLAFVHRDDTPEERQQGRTSYNERMLADGFALPYFIWPNIDPFRAKGNRRAAVPPPAKLAEWLERDGKKLEKARRSVQAARAAKKGIHGRVGTHDKLALESFELRYLAGRRAPDRHVIDLSRAGTADAGKIIEPRSYHSIAHPEDRLFIEGDDLPLFLERGYELAN